MRRRVLLFLMIILIAAGTMFALPAMAAEYLDSDIRISNPSSGDIVETNTMCEITWSVPTACLEQNLYYSLDDGSSWSSIATVIAGIGSYDWKVPNVSSNEARIKVQILVLESSSTEVYTLKYYNKSGRFTIKKAGDTLKAPSNLNTAAESSSSILVSWKDNSSNESGFRVERRLPSGNWNEVKQTSANITEYKDTGLQPYTKYYYRVRAYNSSGLSDYSNEDSVRTLEEDDSDKPKAPSSLTAEAVTSQQVNLKWKDNSSNENGFKIERKTSSSSWSVITTVGSDVVKLSDTDVKSNTKYYYRVRAYNDEGYSEYSNEDYVTTSESDSDEPKTPTNLNADAVSYKQVTLKWQDNSNNENGFDIERKTSSSSWNEIASVGKGVVKYTDNSVSPDTKYYYRVRAYNNAGHSDYSNEDNVKTPENDSSNRPVAPQSLSAESVTYQLITLNWLDKSSNETGFRIERKTSSTWKEIGTVSANTIKWSDSDVVSGTEYTYRVRAYNSYGNSDYSNEKTITAGGSSQLAAPSNLNATVISSAELLLKWTDNSSNEKGFIIERKIGSGSYKTLITVKSNITSYNDIELVPSTKYSYRVRAYNSSGYSAYSNEITTTTSSINSNNRGRTVLRFSLGSSVYYVNDQPQTMDAVPVVRNSRVFIPIRYVGTALGADVGWQQAESKVTIKLDQKIVELWINSNRARVNGISTLVDLDNSKVMPFTVPPGRTMLPLRFIAENLGCDVNWNQSLGVVTITYNP